MKSLTSKSIQIAFVFTLVSILFLLIYNYHEQPFWEMRMYDIKGPTSFSYGQKVNSSMVLGTGLLLMPVFTIMIYLYLKTNQTGNKIIDSYKKERLFFEETWINNSTEIRFKKNSEFLKIEDNKVYKGNWEFFDSKNENIIVNIAEESILYQKQSDTLLEKETGLIFKVNRN